MERLLRLSEEISNSFGAPGFEDDVIEVIKKNVKLSTAVDSINNLYIGLEEIDSTKPIVALDCHSDEVGFMVESIKNNGQITFLPLGGWYPGNVPAHSVVIKNFKGEYIKGIVASKPPHFMTLEELSKLPKISELTIDIGTSSYEETTEIYGIEVGNPIVPDVCFSYDEKIKIMRGKAFDNRLGCVSVVETLKRLEKEKLNVNLVGNICAQEEVGTRGAQVAGNRVKPDFVIVFEGSPADDNFKEGKASHGALRRGLQFRVLDGGMLSNPRVIKFAKEIAKEHAIPYQVIAREKGSTNGAKYHLCGEGIPVIVIGIPTRYIHTHYSYSALEDLEAGIKLAVEISKKLTKEIIEKF